MICSPIFCLFVSRSFLLPHEAFGGFRLAMVEEVEGALLPVKFERSASRSRLINLQWKFIQWRAAARHDLSKSESSPGPTPETRVTVTL